MNFGQSNSNNREAANVNTTAISFKNSEGSSPSAMVIGYWNSLLSIKLHPALDKAQQTETNKFNYEKVISTAITLEKMITLTDRIEDTVIPAIKENKSVFKGVPVGDNTLVGVGCSIEDGVPTAYFVIYKGLDDSTKKPESYLKYNFRTSYTVDDYDPETGKFDITTNVQGELFTFMAVLNAARIGLSNSTVHADRHVNKFFRDKFMGRIDEIAVKIGLPAAKTGGGGYNRGGNSGNVFSFQSKSEAAAPRNEGNYEAPLSSVSNIEDLDGYM